MTLYKLVFIYFLFNLFNVSTGSSGYDSLDPWGDGPSVFSNKKQVDLAIVPPSSEKKCITSKQDSFNNAEIMPYYKRLLNMIFRQSAFKREHDSDNFIRTLHLRISKEKFPQILGAIETSEDLRKLDGIITEVFANSEEGLSEKIAYMIDDWYYSFWMALERPHVKVLLVTSVFLLLVLYFKYVSKHSTFQIVFALLLIISYCWTYYEMYMEEEIERLMTMKKYPTIPKECTVESMSYVEKMIYQFKKSFASDPCKDYYVVTSKTTFEVVNPAIVAVEMFTRLVTHPVTTGSKKLGESIYTLYNSIPWPYNIILFPIALIFLFLFLILFASWAFGIDINFNALFHLFSLSIRSRKSAESAATSTKTEESPKPLTSAYKLPQITDLDLKYIEQVKRQCEKFLQQKEEKLNMIEYKNQELEKKTSPVKLNGSTKCVDEFCDQEEDNNENVNLTNCLKPNMTSSPKTMNNDFKKQNKIRTDKVYCELLKNINDLESRLEFANRSISEELEEIQKKGSESITKA
ncbi:uncharacterized protein LOC113390818 [Ctenocephalides felis]|uniref:uncharacterized protein LOC113390818 n=1 Tax=Ctenocephalides felis TaxID=7515 RepID=UPI000E6E1EDF|nr:uncharacterized protein LOC113390818 [Ctenocephalides felis]